MVIPQPAYRPFNPCLTYNWFSVPKKVGRGAPLALGRSSSSVWIVLLTVSAGNNARLYNIPALAPDKADSQSKRSFFVSCLPSATSSGCFLERWERRRPAVNSFEPNHAAEPPVSRMSVPVWPSHNPRKPVVLMTVLRTSIGPGSFATCGVCGIVPLNCAAGMGETEGGGVASIWTCILHFTSSMGVLRKKESRTHS